MSRPAGWRRLLRLSLGRKSLERDVDDELAFHLAMREERLQRDGLAPADAEAAAHTRFGDRAQIRDECLSIDAPHARRMELMEVFASLRSDVRYALRILRRSPAFTAVAIATLALGIGATSAMFTLVNGILLRPLPYPQSERIVRLIQSYPERGLDTWGVSQQNIALYRDRSTDFEAFSAYRGGGITLNGPTGAERLSILRVTADFFNVVGVQPSLGRAFTRDEDRPGTNNVLVLSHAYWATRFGADPSVIGRTLDFDGQPMQVVGVMPDGFAFPTADVKAWLPMGLDPNRRFGWINAGLGRLKPGVSVAHAERQTTSIMWDWARNEQQVAGTVGIDPSKTRMKTIVMPLQQALTGRTTKPLTILLAAVSLILLIATANVATLLSSRAAAREREIGVRTALGATRQRVLRQLVTESMVLGLLGGVCGMALAYGLVRAFTHSTLVSLPRIGEVSVDGRVLMMTLGISVLSGAIFGLLPAAHGARGRLSSTMRGGARDGSSGAVRRLNNGLVIAQLSLSVVLLVSAGLVLKSFQRLMQTDLGFRTDDLTTISLPLPQRINSAGALNAFTGTTLTAIRAIPGVSAASLSWGIPFENSANVDGYLIQGRPTPPSGNEDQITQTGVSPGYFTSLGIPLKVGRDFTTSDDTTGAPVAIVDENLVRRYWTNAEAIGKRIRVGGDSTWFTIVGVVGDVRDRDAASESGPHLYNSLVQVGGNRLSLVVKSSGDRRVMMDAVRRELGRIEPSIPLDNVRTVSSLVDRSLDTRRLTEILLAAFAGLAVLLAAVGVYGVMALSVSHRQREFGVKLAIGASPAMLVRGVLREGAALAAIGIVLGVTGGFAAARAISSQLYETSAADPVVFVGLSALLAGIAIAACYVPARRAARVDPLVAMRGE